MSYSINENLKRYRFHSGLTQAEFAKKTKTPKSTISRIEQGKNIPGLESLIKISKALDVPLDYLIDNDSREYKILASIVFAQRIKESGNYDSISESVKAVFDKSDVI